MITDSAYAQVTPDLEGEAMQHAADEPPQPSMGMEAHLHIKIVQMVNS